MGIGTFDIFNRKCEYFLWIKSIGENKLAI